MNVCVDKEYGRCTSKIIKSKDLKKRCQKHYNIFNYGFCKERHFNQVPATGKDSLCFSHRSGVRKKIVLSVGDVNNNNVKIIDGPIKNKNHWSWKVLCPVCNKSFICTTTSFKNKKSCYGCRGKLLRKSSEIITWKNHYGMVKSRKIAKEKGFDITFKQFVDISSKNCYYCNAVPTETKGHRSWSHTIFTNGLDRVNPEIGYLYKNVVPCCKNCNIAKLDKTKKDFYLWVKKLVEHQKKIGNDICNM